MAAIETAGNKVDPFQELRPESHSIKLLSSQLKDSAQKYGFERTFEEHSLDLATCALDCPEDFQRLMIELMEIDPSTRGALPVIPKNKSVDEFSKEELQEFLQKAGVEARAPEGKIEPRLFSFWKRGMPGVTERNGEMVRMHDRGEFRNWGRTVSSRPRYTFAPTTKTGVQNVVKFAKKEGLRVRVAASTHSWSPLYGSDDEILIHLAPRKFGRGGALHPENPQDVELESIELIREIKEGAKVVGGLVKIGASATSDHFRAWALEEGPGGGNRKWTFRALPVLVEITFGGNISAICHGSGITSMSVSDCVSQIEFVNANGDLQTVDDAKQLRAAAGCFGLLGIVTSITFRVEPMTYASFFPKRVPAPLAVPPVSLEDIPKNQFDISADSFTEAQFKDAMKQFAEDSQKYYSEWFWFPFQSSCWVNCWDNDATPDPKRPIYPDAKEVRNQNKQAALGVAFENTVLKLLPPEKQARLLAKTSMALLPSGKPLPTPVTEALHFRRGIHRMPVLDMEFEIPIPARKGDPHKPDLAIVQKAWWMAIQEVYDQLPRVPMRTTLEMRIIGGSDMIMATHRGNKFGTCSIEVLTNLLTDGEEWMSFKQAILDRWASLTDPTTGEPLNIRAHWAKEWVGLQLRGKPIEEYYKTVSYADAIPIFKATMSKVAEAGGYELTEAFKIFGNDKMLEVLSA